MTLDVYTLGEAMIRLSAPRGIPLEIAPAFDVHVAGAEANVAHTLGRLGRSVAWASRLPDSSLGRRVTADLRAADVDCSNVEMVPGARMGTYFVDSQSAPRTTQVIYDRSDSAVCDLGADDIDWTLVADASIVHLTGITPALSPSLSDAVTAVATTVAASETRLSFDVNYRSKLWSPEAAAETLEPIMELADIVVCGRGDASELFGLGGESDAVARQLAERYSIESVVVTDGERGAWWRHEEEAGYVESVPVDVTDRLGAGDAFTAGLIDGVLDGDFADGVSRGVALAAIALATQGDRGHATRSEMLDLMEGGQDVDR